MLENIAPTMADTATKTAVHVPWLETAFKAIDRPDIEEPERRINTSHLSPWKSFKGNKLT